MNTEDPKSIEKKALYELVRGLYRERLSERELEEVKVGVDNVVENAHALRAVKLSSRDEPSTLFKPHRRGD